MINPGTTKSCAMNRPDGGCTGGNPGGGFGGGGVAL
jgi:hypothetical protein